MVALRSVSRLVADGFIKAASEKEAVHAYIQTAYKGVIKILSKMGISTIQSYIGAQNL
jgi:hypothetical protein